MDYSWYENSYRKNVAQLNETKYQESSDILKSPNKTQTSEHNVTFNQSLQDLTLYNPRYNQSSGLPATFAFSPPPPVVSNTTPSISYPVGASVQSRQQKHVSSSSSVNPTQAPLNHGQPVVQTKSCASRESFEAMITNLPLSKYPPSPREVETAALPAQTTSTSDQPISTATCFQRGQKNLTCSDDIVFIGEVEKPELSKSSDIIFVRRNFNRSGVVCLTPNRKLRRQKSAPYRISVDDDTTEFKVTISQKKGSTTTTLPNNEWSYETKSGLKVFDPNTTSLLEHLYINRSDLDSNITITLPVTGESYRVNMEKLTMTNVRSGEEVFLLRIPFETNQTDVASSSSHLGDFPSDWSPQVNEIELVEVTHASNNSEWMRIVSEMRKSLPNINIQRLERIQSKKLWIRYAFQKAMLIDKNGIANEKMLFHGTSTNPPWKIYQSEDGFDMRYSRNGAWGCGIYFAEKAAYSHDYAHVLSTRGSSRSLQMFVATVLTGNSCYLLSDNSLRRPPVRVPATATEPEVLYDSVTGIRTTGAIYTRVYVLYKFDMAYPSYLVTYST